MSRHKDFFNEQLSKDSPENIYDAANQLNQPVKAFSRDMLRGVFAVTVGDLDMNSPPKVDEMKIRIKKALSTAKKDEEDSQDVELLKNRLRESPQATELFISKLIQEKLPGIENSEMVLQWFNRQTNFRVGGLILNDFIDKKYSFLVPRCDWDLIFREKSNAIFFEKDKKLMVQIPLEVTFRADAEKDNSRVIDNIIFTTSFSNIAEAGQPPRYAFCFESIAFQDKNLKTLLEMDPKKAEKQISLHRKILFYKFNENDVSDLIKDFDRDLREKLENPETDCTNMDLSGLDLTGINLSGKNLTNANLTNANLTNANLTNANLTNANLDNNTKLRGAKFSIENKPDFNVWYRGVEFKHQDDVLPMINKMRNAHYYKTGSIAPMIDNIFELLRYIQENPKENFSIAADRELLLTAIRKLAKMPFEEKGDKYNVADHLLGWNKAVKGKGLGTPEISQVVQHSEAHVHGQSVGKKRYTAAKSNVGPRISFGLLERDGRAVINVEQTLSEKEEGASFIAPLNFAALIADIAKLDIAEKKIDCIQMPLAVMEKGRQHYVQLQIYKTTNGEIGARIIDSTANPIAIPVDFVKSLLIENREQLKAVLLTEKNTVTVSEVHTNEQLRLGDKKCGIYVAAGMKATAEKVLAEGADFLSNDAKAKDAVRHQHHLVSKTEPLGYLIGMVNISAEQLQPAMGSEGSVSGSAQSMKTVLQSAATPSAVADNGSAAAAAAASSDDDLSKPLLPSSPAEKSDSLNSFEAVEADDIEPPAEEKPQPAYAHIKALLENVDLEKLKIAVEEALTSYQKDRGWTLNFFRQLSSAGKDYAADALKRIKDGSDEVVRDIAREILFMGVQPDGKTIEVKHNSRVHHLLMAMEKRSLIGDVNAKDIGVMGKSVNTANDLKVVANKSPRP